MKNHYLQIMGITRWQLRLIVNYYLVTGQNHNGVLIAVINDDRDHQQVKLLQAILQALKFPVSPLPNLNGFEKIQSVALGHFPATFCTYSLKEMLQDNHLKAPVWRCLQDFIKHL
ncbi:MAG: DNA polymerase III subunit psi [Proteobacteria bacterium]|nr:DNA polymerase III subunit psi [Pseudomonadota bacterium]